jgi:polar amino acid transport system permease protein
VAALACAGLEWWQLLFFDSTLHLAGAELVVCRAVLVLLAGFGLATVVYGISGVQRAVGATRLADQGELSDARARAEDARDAMWFVTGLGLTALIFAFLAFLFGANDGALRSVMFDFTYMWKGHEALLRGFWLNIKIFLFAQVLVLVWALLVAVVRMLPGRACAPVRLLAIVYTDVFRGVPAIIVIYLVVLGFGLAGVPVFNSMSKDNQIFWLAVLALTLVYGAYVSEVYRAGIESVHWSQTAAARSLGLSQWQTLRYVVVPQAIRRVLPPLINDAVALQKDTALTSIVGYVEVLGAAQLLKNKYFNLSPVFASALFFLVITIPFTRLTDYLLKREKRRTQGGS